MEPATNELQWDRDPSYTNIMERISLRELSPFRVGKEEGLPLSLRLLPEVNRGDFREDA